MTILEVLKKIKHLDRKRETSIERIKRWGSHLDNETSPYDVSKLVQSVNSFIEEIAKLRHLLHKVNITQVVKFEGKNTSLDELIIIKTYILPNKIATLKELRRKEKCYGEPESAKVINNFDHAERDKQIDKYENSLAELDSILDSLNISIQVDE
jgi:hypothetical protein